MDFISGGVPGFSANFFANDRTNWVKVELALMATSRTDFTLTFSPLSKGATVTMQRAG